MEVEEKPYRFARPLGEIVDDLVSEPDTVMGSASQGVPMKGIHEVCQEKEAELARVRKEVEGLRLIAPLLSNDPERDARDVLRQKEADLAWVRKEIESLQLVAPLLSDELSSDDELTRKPASSTQETLDRSVSDATGTDGLFPSLKASPRPRFWEILKGKT